VPVRLADLDLDRADAGLEGGGGLLLHLLHGGLEEAARGVVDPARVAEGAEQLGQRQAGAARLEVPQGDVERRDGLGGDAGPADRGARPEQRLVDLRDVGRILADGGLGDLLEMGVLRRPARSLGVAEPHALQALLRRDLDEQQDRVGQRLLPAGEHLGVADGRGELENDVGELQVLDGV
jgi:hypothetical protein